MRFKHTKTILLIITNLLLLSLLYIGYQKIQRVREQKAYQDQFAKVTQLEKSSEKGKDVQVQEGILGTSYVTAYYPTKDGQPVEIVKDKYPRRPSASRIRWKNQRTKAIWPSTIVKKQKRLLLVITLSKSNGLNTSTKKGKFIKDETVKLPLFYLDDESNPLTLSQVFADPDGAKQIFLEELRGNLDFRQLDEESIDQMVAHFSELDLSQWEFQYEKGNFTIPFPTKVKGDDTFTVPLSKFYDVIDTERLLLMI